MATHGLSPTAASLPLLLSLLVLTAASPPPRYLPTLSRVATYDDIPSSFASIYQTAPICPDTLTFSTPTIDERLVALLPLPSVTQDETPCAGPGPTPAPPLSLVSEATVEQPGLLTALNLAAFRAALDANPNAQSLVASSNTTSMLVGHHPTDRVCGNSTFPPSTIYFIIRETEPFRISFNRSNTLELVTLPSQLKALLIVAQNSAVCLLVDRGSNPGPDATLTTTSPDGEAVTTALTPFGASPAPAPSTVPSITPVVSPSPVPGGGSSTEEGAGVGPVVTPAPSVDVVAETEEEGGEEVVVVETGEAEAGPEESMQPEESVEFVLADGGASGETGQGAVGGEADGMDGAMVTADGSEVMPFEGEADDGSACFPGEAEVVLESGEVRRMEQLEIGDRVRSGEGGVVSDVMVFTHRERKGWYRFVRLELEGGQVLEVSRGHYVYVGKQGMKKAGAVAAGEVLAVDGGRGGRVMRVASVVRRGLFNPQTVDGMVMVNGVRVSTYTTAVEPRLAHGALLAPVRFLYRWLGGSGVGVVGWGLEGGAAAVVGLMPRGASVVGV